MVISHFGDIPWSPRAPDLSPYVILYGGAQSTSLNSPTLVTDRTEDAAIDNVLLTRVKDNFQTKLGKGFKEDIRHMMHTGYFAHLNSSKMASYFQHFYIITYNS